MSESKSSRQPRPIMSDPDFRTAFNQLTRRLGVAGGVLTLLIWVAAVTVWPFADGQSRYLTAVVTVAAVVILIAAAWAGLKAAASHQMDTMMVWVGGGFFVRITIVFATIVLAKTLELNTRLVGCALAITILAVSVLEIRTLAKARINRIEPLS